MISAAAIIQLSRILGRDEFYRRLSLPKGQEGQALTPAQVALVQDLAQERLPQLADALLEEALASDDILDAAAADAYLEERLAFFAELLTEEQQKAIRRRYRRVTALWA